MINTFVSNEEIENKLSQVLELIEDVLDSKSIRFKVEQKKKLDEVSVIIDSLLQSVQEVKANNKLLQSR